MNRVTDEIRTYAERLITHEASVNKPSGASIPAAFHVCEKLRPPLATLMGHGGFRALLTRALALANAEVPPLRAVRVKADGALEVSDEPGTQVDPETLAEGGTALLAQLLGLLVAFIGANLTLHLVREIWPKVPLNDLEFDNGGKGEEAK